MGRWLWLGVLVIVLDQVTKLAAERLLVLHQPVPVLPGLNLTLVYNRGAAFSFLASHAGWQRWFLSALAAVVSAALVVWILRLKAHERLLAAGLALIVGGALGNLVDRVLYGHVIDFVDVYHRQWHWPAFNVADSAIVVGAALVVLDAFRGTAPSPSR